MKRYKHRTANKPYSEKTKAEKIAEHKGAIARLSHPHNLNFATLPGRNPPPPRSAGQIGD